jgi:hypothetical protein
MDISIEFVFLFACALFVLHFIMSGCRYTNVEGYECGSCPWSTAKCPDECISTPTEKCGVLGLGKGAKYECACKPSYAGGKPVCLDTGSGSNLDIGILDLSAHHVEIGLQVRKAYMYEQQKWVEYTWVVDRVGSHLNDANKVGNTVTDTDKLSVLNKLFGAPYYIQNIDMTTMSNSSWMVGVKTYNHDKGKHFYFSDRTGDVYCLAVTRWGVNSPATSSSFASLANDENFPHTVGAGETHLPAHIQYLGHKESNLPSCVYK